MSEFLTKLRVELVDPYANDGTGLWAPIEDFRYYSTKLKREIVIPKGFVHDFASVPRLPMMYALTGNRYHIPALIHDYLCRMRLCRRETADKVFLEAMMLQNRQELAHMKSQNIDPEEIEKRKSDINTRANAMYLAVALFTKSGLWDNKLDLTPVA